MRKDIVTRIIGILILLVSIPVHAYDFTDNGIYFDIKSDGSLEVTGLASWTTRADILSDVTINGRTYLVTSIGKYAFEGRSDITYLSIPWSVTSIGEYAFIDCGSNMTVNIADPESWCQMQLGNEHSSPLSSAGRVMVHDIETSNIVIPEGVTSIGNFTFYQCRCITSLFIPSSVTSIGSSAFEDCTGLTSITLSEGLTSIGGSSFEECKGITSITIPSTVSSISINAFQGCTSLNTITSEIQNPFVIDESVFSTYSTATLNVPRGTKYSYQSTAGWNKFVNIVASKEGGEIGETFESGGIYYTIGENNIVSVTRREVQYSGDVVIPNQVAYKGNTYNVTTIGNGAFESCIGLLSVTIPSSIKIIDIDAFKNCINLTAVNTSDISSWCNITFVDHYSNPLYYAHHLFLNGTEITTLNIPKSLSRIKSYTFQGCSGLTSVTIPDNVTSIGDYAFGNCKNLNTVILEIQKPFRIDESIFSSTESDIYASATLVVPIGTRAAYKATEGWNKFSNITDGTSDTEFIKNDIAFFVTSESTVEVKSVSNSLKRVEIPNSVSYNGTTYKVTSLGERSFEGRDDLTYLSIPSSIAFIGEHAFIDCGSNIEVNISNLEAWCKVTFGDQHSCPLSSAKSFYLNGSEVSSLTIPNSVTSIPGYAFFQCKCITSLSIPSSVTSVGSSAFEDCIGLTSVSLTDGLTHIGGSAFEGCTSLPAITIPSTVTAISVNAFNRCSNLNDIISMIQKPFVIDSSVFSTYSTATLTVPYGTKTAYQTTAGWNNFGTIVDGSEFTINNITYVTTSSNTVSVKSAASSQKRVIIPESVSNNGTNYRVTTLAERSFEGRDDITYLSIPSSIISIGEYAFMDCGNNIEVNIESLEAWCKITFGDKHSCPLSSAKCFYLNSSEIRELIIPNSVTSIPGFAFFECKCIMSLTIPSSVTSIGNSAFEDCIGLTSFSLSDGLISIGGSAFEGCTGLTSIVLPGSITTIAINSFKECTNLNDIVSEIQHPFVIDGNVFSTYSTATLKVPNGTKADYKATAGWNNFSKIVDGTESNEFEKDGITYETTSSGTIKVESVDKVRVSIEIPSSVSYEGEIYTVTDINKHAFDGCQMAALIWNVDFALPSDVLDNMDMGSNFLLYVKSDSYAPSSVKNVIVDGNAQSILLSDDGGQFYCPLTFTARSISYTHNYSMETGGDGKGWETIALPFDVQRISHSLKGEIVPFASYNKSSSQKPFWLANYSGSSFRRTSAIKANEPYIIAMPNSSKYKSDYILAGDVSFSAENVQVTKTPSFNGRFIPTFATVAKSSTVHALNVNNRYVKYSGSYEAGSRFVSDLRDICPFEAYISDSSTRGIIEIHFDDNATEMNQILSSPNEGQKVIIHTLSGQKVDNSNLSNFELLWNKLPKGVYIVNGKKMIK